MFKKLKSLFIIEDENPQADQQKQTASPKQGNTSPNTNQKTSNPAKNQKFEKPAPDTGKPEEKFINRLLGALEENNLKGFDYLEYKSALQNLGNVSMDEATRYKSALAMATTMGADAPKLIDSAKHYVNVLKKEENKFINAFKAQTSKLVTDQETSFKNLEASIIEKEKQIELLKKQVEEHKATLKNRKQEINKANAKVQATKENFYASYNTVVDQINADIEKMTNYLK